MDQMVSTNIPGYSHPFQSLLATSADSDGPPMVQRLAEDGSELPGLNRPDTAFTRDWAREIYQWMLRVRVYDSRLTAIQRQGRIQFFVPSTGEEAVQIGTAAALRPLDWIFPAYREQGALLHRGLPLRKLLAQLLGSWEDNAKGRQMPDHFGAQDLRIAFASSPVGTQIPQAVGAAWSLRLQREDSAVVVYFGDGATSTGDFHAGMTLAAVQQAPVVFCCKNNGWAISLPSARQCRVESLALKAAGYGMPGLRVDGNDIFAVYEVTQQALDWSRSGAGPVFIEFVTQRMGPHSTADDPSRYRDSELMDAWERRDPLVRVRQFLERRSWWTAAEEAEFRAAADSVLLGELCEAEAAPRPPLESLVDDVYSDLPWHLKEQRDEVLTWHR